MSSIYLVLLFNLLEPVMLIASYFVTKICSGRAALLILGLSSRFLPYIAPTGMKKNVHEQIN